VIEIHRYTYGVEIRRETAASRGRPLQKSQLSLCATDDGRRRDPFVEELDQRNERRSRTTIRGTGDVVRRKRAKVDDVGELQS
jgi:hypothetical protein